MVEFKVVVEFVFVEEVFDNKVEEGNVFYNIC